METSLGTLGHYQLLEKVGAGGFGCVYRAWDSRLERCVAIKTCDVESDETRDRFAREARLAGSLSHPNIVLILDFQRDGDVLFLVQEFLDGEDLVTLMRRGEPSQLAEKLRILDGISAGLEHAHRRGVVHRDIKPGNVRILKTGGVKILDFGIARAFGDDVGITRPGMLIGSAGYMSPEQIRGDPVDHRTDLFGIGVLAYELLSGRHAFESTSVAGLMEAILEQEPEPLSHVAAVPPALEQLVRSAMAKDVAARPASAAEFRARLARIAAEDQRRARPIRMRDRIRAYTNLRASGAAPA